jgi:hypothetical protein
MRKGVKVDEQNKRLRFGSTFLKGGFKRWIMI